MMKTSEVRAYQRGYAAGRRAKGTVPSNAGHGEDGRRVRELREADARVAPVFCACGAHWHGKHAAYNEVIDAHRHRAQTGEGGCAIISEDMFHVLHPKKIPGWRKRLREAPLSKEPTNGMR